MTGHDDLRARLAATDPARPGAALDPLPASSPAELKERVMQTMDQPTATPERPASDRWRRPLVLAAAAVIVAATVGVGGVLTLTDDDPAPRPPAPTTVALSAAPGGAMSSCLPFDVALLADMPVAFAGTATAVNADAVTLDVDRWYTGGSAAQVTIRVPSGQSSIALDGVDFVDGQRYLLTATEGTVNGCGFSGRATPELEAAFAEAFSG